MVSEQHKAKRRVGAADVELGRKVRTRRLDKGLSQSALAEAIGLTFQQVQKYEKGTNRVSAARLNQIAAALDCPVTFFYAGMAAARKRGTPAETLSFMQTKGAMRLVKAYAGIPSRAGKYALVVLAEGLRARAMGSPTS